jgi:hypothetical protein
MMRVKLTEFVDLEMTAGASNENIRPSGGLPDRKAYGGRSTLFSDSN